MNARRVLGSATYPAVAASAGEGRRFARTVLGAFFEPGDERLDNAVLAICEAMTNSIEHSDSRFGGKVTLAIYDLGGGEARIEITDDGGPTVPTGYEVLDTATGGRGIRMIELLTLRSGHLTDDAGRLTYWFEL